MASEAPKVEKTAAKRGASKKTASKKAAGGGAEEKESVFHVDRGRVRIDDETTGLVLFITLEKLSRAQKDRLQEALDGVEYDFLIRTSAQPCKNC